jgi:hypothetical protein
MATEFEVNSPEDFERLIQAKDIRITKALTNTILKNLKSKKRHHHALSIICNEDDTIFDVTIDKRDFLSSLKSSLPAYESEELYEECSKIVNAIDYLKMKDKLSGCVEGLKKK